jgi:uncharacterized protein
MDPVGRFLGLAEPVARVDAERGTEITMRDGVVLRADHYAPRVENAPTVLVRTPYGRGGPTRWLARAVARRGFHVVVQSCRGTGDSDGTFTPLIDERADGLDTLDWLAKQDWYDGRLCTFGPSYVGFVQWALAAEAGDQLQALATIVTASTFADSTYSGGAFSLDSVLTWSALIEAQRGPRLANAVELLRGQPKLHRGLAHLPLAEADRIATGVEIRFFQEWLVESDPANAYWQARGHFERLADVKAPVLMVGGWYDIFLPWQLDDYAALRAAGARPYLTIGPWTHGSLGLFRHSAAESVDWFKAHTSGGTFRALPVRVHVGGADEWREFPDWPPPDGRPVRWYLRPGGGLSPDSTRSSTVDNVGEFTYDPADPTPALGGPRLAANVAGRKDNRPLEARADVLTYTSDPLDEPVEVIGPVTATVSVRASAPFYDVFVRVCDVDQQGRSWNVCDGLKRVTAATTEDEVRVRLWPTAYRFAAGHRIRVQISGGAHPRFARNPGTAAGLGEPSELVPVRRAIRAPSFVEFLS